MAYVCFFSYASVNRTKFMDKFMRELTQAIMDKTGEPPVDVAFFAPSEIKTGEEWAEVLGGALRTSKVIVCLCTPHYFTSRYCGKEVGVFLLRREAFRAMPGNEHRKVGVVFPIVWEWPLGGLHSVLAKFQNRQEGFPKTYTDNGLNALIRLRRETDFQAVVITLAAQIRDAIQESRLPDWPTLPAFDQIESVFHEQVDVTRYQYGLALLHPQGTAWRPFADGPGLYELCDFASAQTGRLCRPLIAGPDLVDRLRQSASNREAFLVLTDISSAEGVYKETLDELNKAALPNTALFVTGGDTPQEERTATLERLRASLGNLFNQTLPHSWLTIRSVELLTSSLVDAMVKLGVELIKTDPAKRVNDEELIRTAFESGIRTDSAPVLAGPGR